MFLSQQTNLSKQKQMDKGNLEGGGYVCYPDCGNGVMAVCIVQTHQSIHTKYVQFISFYINDTSIKMSENNTFKW